MKSLKQQHRNSTQRDDFLEKEIVASVTECTGLIPSLTDADPDAELRRAVLYGIHPPKKRDGERREGTSNQHKRKEEPV